MPIMAYCYPKSTVKSTLVSGDRNGCYQKKNAELRRVLIQEIGYDRLCRELQSRSTRYLARIRPVES